jgi:TolA-binding protein
MAPQNDPQNDNAPNDQQDELGISEEDAEQLLADAVDDEPDERPRRRARGKDDDDADDENEDDDSAGLGDRGRRALEAEKQRRKAARAELGQTRQQLNAVKRELEELKGGNKSELQRLIDERDVLKEQLGQVSSVAKRRDVAEELAPEHATPKQIRLVAKYLTGSTDDELEASAEELFDQFAPEPSKVRTPTRPKERLRGGGDPEEEPEELDPRKLADLVKSRKRY